MTCSFGDVLLVPFPFTDQSAIKKRPAIVVSADSYTQRHKDVVLIAVTSRLSAASYPNNLAIQRWQQAGLLRPSVIKPIVTTLQSNLLLKICC